MAANWQKPLAMSHDQQYSICNRQSIKNSICDPFCTYLSVPCPNDSVRRALWFILSPRRRRERREKGNYKLLAAICI
jgi:hypothetical protein